MLSKLQVIYLVYVRYKDWNYEKWLFLSSIIVVENTNDWLMSRGDKK